MTMLGSELHKLLIDRLPNYVQLSMGQKRLKVYELAEAVGYSPQYIYQILRNTEKPDANVPIKFARRLIECSEKQTGIEKGFKPLTLADMEPFLPV